MKRIICAFLAVVMILALLPVAAQADTTGQITDFQDMGYLGWGFNLLGNSPMENLTMSDKGILKSLTNVDAKVSDARNTQYLFTYIQDLSSYMYAESASASYGVEVNANIKMLSLEAKAKFGLHTASSFSQSGKTEYAVLSVLRTYEKKYMDLSSTKYIQRLWQQDETGSYLTLDDDFVEELYSVGLSETAIESFFAKYGTHIVTRYVSGGEATLAYSGEELAKAVSSSFAWEANVSGSIGVGGLVDISAEMERTGAVEEGSVIGSSDISFTGTVKGGDGLEPSEVVKMMQGGETSITTWTNSINASNSQILVNDRPSDEEDTLRLLPIWELLYKPEDVQLKIALEEYFNRNVNSQYADFYEAYIYDPVYDPDYSDHQFITHVSQLDAIRNDLDGKYVLLCDLNLAGAQWTPIGTEEAPFTGELDGNGCTISGLSVTQICGNAAGLFGHNDGTILNLCVEGVIDTDAAGSEGDLAYVGGIAGVNSGVIAGCKNLVSVNGSMTITAQGPTAQTQPHLDYDPAAVLAALTPENTYDLTTHPGGTIALDDVTVIKLTGENTNPVNLTLSYYSDTPLWIILEDAQLTAPESTPALVSSCARPVWILSQGTANSISGGSEASAIDAPEAPLYLVGDAQLNLYGGNGTDGADGTDGKNATSTGGRGENGGNGIAGTNGAAAVNAATLFADTEGIITLTGGSGGNGGNGGDGGIGQAGADKTDYYAAKGGDGGNGGNGGNGAAGGMGSNALGQALSAVTLYNGQLQLACGVCGSGGNGGNGGDGGRGGNASATSAFGASVSGSGGDGGRGGDSAGANNSQVSMTLPDTVTIYNEAFLLSTYVDKEKGVAGMAGSGGNGAKPGTTNTTTHKVGSWGSNGNPGTAGVTIASTDSVTATLYTGYREYALVDEVISYEAASGQAQAMENTCLVSIGSEKEQLQINALLSEGKGSAYWMGLYWNSQRNRWYWEDGNQLYVPSLVDCEGSGGKYTYGCAYDEFDEVAFSHWASGKPSSSSSGNAVQLQGKEAMDAQGSSLLGYWLDGTCTEIAAGYVYERTLNTDPEYQKDRQVFYVGGIAGYNDFGGMIKGCINEADLTIDKVYASEAGAVAAAGGIAGANEGTAITQCYNTGRIRAVAKTDSASQWAMAYAYEICKDQTADCVVTGTEETPLCEAVAKSSNDLDHTGITEDFNGDLSGVQVYLDHWKHAALQLTRVNKTDYVAEGEFDPDTIELRFQGQIVEDYTIWYYFLKPGCRMVKVSFSNGEEMYQRSFPVTVAPATVETVQIAPDSLHQTQFSLGETFNAQGLILSLHYNNGTVQKAAVDPETVSVPDLTTYGEKTVTLLWDAQTVEYTITVAATGSLLEGSVHSGGSNADEVVLNLYRVGEETSCYRTTSLDDHYVMEGVTPGSYTLTVSKVDHVTREYSVTVAQGQTVQDVWIVLRGDVTTDNRVNIGDVAKVYSHIRNAASITDPYLQQAADVNGDGKINIGDAAGIYASIRGVKPL